MPRGQAKASAVKVAPAGTVNVQTQLQKLDQELHLKKAQALRQILDDLEARITSATTSEERQLIGKQMDAMIQSLS